MPYPRVARRRVNRSPGPRVGERCRSTCLLAVAALAVAQHASVNPGTKDRWTVSSLDLVAQTLVEAELAAKAAVEQQNLEKCGTTAPNSDAAAKYSHGSWWKVPSTVCDDTAHLPPWTIWRLGPLLRTPERRLKQSGKLAVASPARLRPPVPPRRGFCRRHCRRRWHARRRRCCTGACRIRLGTRTRGVGGRVRIKTGRRDFIIMCRWRARLLRRDNFRGVLRSAQSRITQLFMAFGQMDYEPATQCRCSYKGEKRKPPFSRGVLRTRGFFCRIWIRSHLEKRDPIFSRNWLLVAKLL